MTNNTNIDLMLVKDMTGAMIKQKVQQSLDSWISDDANIAFDDFSGDNMLCYDNAKQQLLDIKDAELVDIFNSPEAYDIYGNIVSELPAGEVDEWSWIEILSNSTCSA